MQQFVLKRRHIAGYMLGDLGNVLTFTLTLNYLLKFYNSGLGVSGHAIAIVILIARIWDGINDPIMGLIADRVMRPTAKGRFRPFLLRGAIPVAVLSALIFNVPLELSAGATISWMALTYIIWGMAYTFINIPYGSLATVMARTEEDRTKLSSARSIGGLVGTVAITFTVPGLVSDNSLLTYNNFKILSAVIAVLAVVFYLASYFLVEEPEIPPENIASFTSDRGKSLCGDIVAAVLSPFRMLANNQVYLVVAICSIAMLTGMSINGAISLYYFQYNIGNTSYASYNAFIVLLLMLVLALILPSVIKSFGLQKTVYGTTFISTLAYVALLILPDGIITYYALMPVGMLALITFNIVVWGMVSDSIDYEEYLTGRRAEGKTYGSYSLVRKLGQAAGGGISAFVVGLLAIKDSTILENILPEQLNGIRWLMFGSQLALMIIVFICFRFFWILTPELRKKIQAKVGNL